MGIAIQHLETDCDCKGWGKDVVWSIRMLEEWTVMCIAAVPRVSSYVCLNSLH